MKKILIIVLILAGSQVKAQQPAVITSEKPGWYKLGELTASLETEKDVITVIGNDRFRAIKLKVSKATLNLFDLEVYYESGDMETLQIRQILQPGSETKQLNLKGSLEIKKVVFVYKTTDNMSKDKAQIELYGLK